MALPVSPCLGCIARRFDWRHLICPPPNESGSALLGSAGPQNERVCAKCVWEYFTLSCFNGLFNADALCMYNPFLENLQQSQGWWYCQVR